MQDIKYILENREKFTEIVKNKNVKLDVDNLITTYEKRKDVLQQIESLRSERNLNSDQMKNVGGKPSDELVTKGKELKEQIATLEAEYSLLDSEYNGMMLKTPMFYSEDTPIGPDESGNVEVRRWSPDEGLGGNPKPFNFDVKDHVQLGESLQILDLERGVKTGGFRGYYLKNEATLMHMGLMMFGLKHMQSKGFETFVPPTIVKDQALEGSGHFPFDQDSAYVVETMRYDDDENSKDKKYLIGTAEPSILNYHRDEVLDESVLPLKYAGFSQCYRGEVGSYGRDVKGIYRVHEFMKIEQVVICKNSIEEAERLHQEMVSYAEELLQALKLPYRVIQLCTGDMGAGKYKMYDIETWMPSRAAYGETHSASNLLDWQPRRLNLKVKSGDNKYYPFALNNTVVASPRILIAIWENYQNGDGSITVPDVLREYVGKDIIKR